VRDQWSDRARARRELLSQANEVNSVLYDLLTEFSGLDHSVAAPVPTLENNIWSSNVVIQGAILDRLAQPHDSTDWAFGFKPTWKRNVFGIIVEMLAALARPQFGISAVTEDPEGLGKSSTFLFTYSDYDHQIPASQETSIFWGSLPLWLKDSVAVSWVGMGTRRTEKTRPLQSIRRGLTRILLILEFLKSYPERLRLWTRLKTELRGHSLFAALRRDVRRALFGLPAFEALSLKKQLGAFLEKYHPKQVMVPHENQLWERVLAVQCRKRNINLVGVIHTTPRFWDIRFFSISGFDNMQPDRYVDNGPASKHFLELGGVPSDRIISGSALRFEHLKNPDSRTSVAREKRNPSRALVVTGSNVSSASQLVKEIRGFSTLKDHEIVFRPHPATVGALDGLIGSSARENRSVNDFAKSYDVIITESMSSMALELASIGAKIAVFLPESQLNFSPLLANSKFESYFKDDNELNRILLADAVAIDVSTIITTVNSREKWVQVFAILESEQKE